MAPAPLEVDVNLDGPALTIDGKVLDVDGGAALFFSHDKMLSPSHEAACAAKETMRMLRAVQVAHDADEAEEKLRDRLVIDAGGVVHDVCAATDNTNTPVIDATGYVHNPNAIAPPSPDEKSGNSARSKMFHIKKMFRRQISNVSTEAASAPTSPTLTMDNSGRIFNMDFDDFEPLERTVSVDSIDSHGVIQGPVAASPTNQRSGQLKAFHRKRVKSRSDSLCEEPTVVSVDATGLVRDSWKLDTSPIIEAVAVQAF